MSDEYDPQAIAAAVLQMVYDRDCPDWMKSDWEVPESGISKPIINKKKYGRNSGKDRYRSKPSVNRNRSQGRMSSGVIISEK